MVSTEGGRVISDVKEIKLRDNLTYGCMDMWDGKGG